MCLVLPLAAACDSSARTSVAPSTTAKCAIALNASATTFDTPGGEGRLTVTTERDCTWTATSRVPWISLPSNASGQGTATLRFVVAPNNEPAPRSGEVIAGDQQVTIAQRPRTCSYELSTRDVSVPVSGGRRDVDVRASSDACEWTARSGAEWIAIRSGAAGRGIGRVTFGVSPSAGPPRTGSIEIAGQTVTVRQGDGCAYSVEPAAVSVPAAGGRMPVSVSTAAGCPWSASGGAQWVGASALRGTGASTVQISVSANTGAARTATLTIAGRTVSVSQASGCSFTATPSTVTVFAPGGSANISVTSGAGCQWTAVSQAEWIEVTSGSTGSGNGVVILSVASSVTPQRTGTVIVAGQTVSVTQANGCHYDLSPSTFDAGANGGLGGFQVSTGNGCGWKTVQDGGDGWLFVTRGQEGNGSGPVVFLILPNFGPPRSAKLLIENEPFAIRQAGR